MRRLQLFEFGDQDGVPLAFRHYLTDFLSFAISWIARMPGSGLAPVTRALARALGRTGDHHILDLCSGSGGPAVSVRTALADAGVDLDLTLSDLVPNARALARICEREGDRVRFHPEPLDATAVPPELSGFRTVFNAFHHLPPELARKVLADASRSGRGIAVIEVTERTVASVLFMVIVIPLLVLLTTPFVRPWRWGRLFWTYLVPWMPWMIAFDGVVSSLRTYTVEELHELVSEIEAPGYDWWIERIAAGPPGLGITLLIGSPGQVTLADERGSGNAVDVCR